MDYKEKSRFYFLCLTNTRTYSCAEFQVYHLRWLFQVMCVAI